MKKWEVYKKTNFKSWENIDSIEDFSYPWLDENPPKTLFRAFYDDLFLYFHFTAFGKDPKIYVETNNKLEVRFSERVELFFRRDEDMRPYYCLEMDPNGRVLDYKACMYRKFDRNWTWPDPLDIKTIIYKDKYTLEGKICLKTLRDLGVLKTNMIEIGVYRGHCTKLDKKDDSIKWISWVDSKTRTPDFHVPSSFGGLILK